MNFTSLRTDKIYIRVVNQILDLVRSGQLRPGDKLPAERELVDSLQVSRASVREALSALELTGIISSRPGNGTFVTASRDDIGPSYQMLSLMGNEESPLDILGARRAIEGETAALAAARASAADLEAMRLAYGRMQSEVEASQAFSMEHDRDFHLAIAQAAGNTVLRRLAVIVLDLTRQRLWLTLRDRSHNIAGLPEKYQHQHLAIYEAIVAGDGEAARAHMLTHLGDVEHDIFARGV